jgi:rubrerythrin
MYQKAIDLCEDPKLKEVLLGFRDDESRHEKEVLARYMHFKKQYPSEAK